MAAQPKKYEITTILPTFSQNIATHYANRAKYGLGFWYGQEDTMEWSEGVSRWKASV